MLTCVAPCPAVVVVAPHGHGVTLYCPLQVQLVWQGGSCVRSVEKESLCVNSRAFHCNRFSFAARCRRLQCFAIAASGLFHPVPKPMGLTSGIWPPSVSEQRQRGRGESSQASSGVHHLTGNEGWPHSPLACAAASSRDRAACCPEAVTQLTMFT